MKDHVYLTKDIGYAQIYGMAGNIAGTSHSKHLENDKKEYGDHFYVFGIHGKNLKNVQPDEDSVGELIHDKSAPRWLHPLASKHLAGSTLDKIKQGEYIYYAKAGKVLNKRMSDAQKAELIQNHNTHIAHAGKIDPDEIYRIHRDKIPLLKRDGSNFFEHAEKIHQDAI
jgi:hypothetical protein